MMDINARLDFVWNTLCRPVGRVFEKLYNYTHDTVNPEGPCLIVSNHVTNVDPLLVAFSFPKKHIHFVASEHLFRMGWKSKAIEYLVAPIPRRKGANGTATAMDCLRKMRAGRSVCIFAEGETTWDGRSNKVFSATGTLARASGATLITYRFEGAYFTSPRWGRGIRRGKMHGRIVNTYSPEQLKAMTPAQIEDIMNRDIYEDAWERQKQSPVKYKGKHLAECIEVALFMCPKCKKVGHLVGKGRKVSCTCGFETSITDFGTFSPAVPFENIAQWDKWQHESLKNDDFVHGENLFADENISLVRLSADRAEELLEKGALSINASHISLGTKTFALTDITDMALIQRRCLAVMHGNDYYEMRAEKPLCLRKYLAVWKNAVERAAEEKAMTAGGM